MRCSSSDDKATLSFRQGAETHAFQAEVSRLMDIIVHSLYSNKDIFLRELVSNAADALDKVRFLSLTNTSALGQGDAASLPLEVKISIDKERKILTIHDTGIGMTKADLISNLGTIARSGTAAFLEQMQKGGDLNLIGQFGVGFYSVYLVSDYVEVISKNPSSDTQYIWESSASGQFAVSEDTDGTPLGRGTQINIHIKDTESEYLQEEKIKELIARYSEFINFPISLLTRKEIEKEVPLTEEEEKEQTADATIKQKSDEDKEEKKDNSVDEDVSVVEEEEEEEKKPKTKKVKETVEEWQVLNSAKALWLRPPGNVSEEEYSKFYGALVKNDNETPKAHSHFRAEGDVDFKAVLYVPSTAPPDMYENYYTKKPRIRLYVRRVLISESFEDLLPKWLSFIVGLVDSDSMPLNVSREMLQLNEGLKVIKKKLIRKAIEMLKRMSDRDIKGGEEGEDTTKEKKGWFGSKKDKDASDGDKASDTEKYQTFWNTFGKSIKMGVVEDSTNRKRLLPLLRFYTSASGQNLTNFDEYIKRMKENQTSIYFMVSTDSRDDIAQSPFVEPLLARGYEVIYFTDALDEYVMNHINEYEGKQFTNVAKDDIKLADAETEEEKAKEKKATEYFKGLTAWWKGVINDTAIASVKVTRRLSTAPCVVVASKWGWSATMERIVRAQALGDNDRNSFMRGQRTLEINPRHPLIRELRDRWAVEPENMDLKANAKLLYGACLMESGFILDDVKSLNKRIVSLLGSDMGVKDMTVVPLDEEVYPSEEPSVEEEKKEKPKEEEDNVTDKDANVKDEL